MASLCAHPVWSAIFTFLPVFGVFSLNYVARELEMPFGNDDNDLPLLEFQEHMNNSMLMLVRQETDHVPHASKKCKQEFMAIKESITAARPKSFIIGAGSRID